MTDQPLACTVGPGGEQRTVSLHRSKMQARAPRPMLAAVTRQPLGQGELWGGAPLLWAAPGAPVRVWHVKADGAWAAGVGVGLALPSTYPLLPSF